MSVELTQSEADKLFEMPKYHEGIDQYDFPSLGGSLRIELFSNDRHEEFSLDITRGRVALSKNTFQNRGRRVVILARIDIGGPPHRNPDGVEITCPHLHLFKEGYGDKWAIPLPDIFSDIDDPYDILDKFMDYCNVADKPVIQKGLFS